MIKWSFLLLFFDYLLQTLASAHCEVIDEVTAVIGRGTNHFLSATKKGFTLPKKEISLSMINSDPRVHSRINFAQIMQQNTVSLYAIGWYAHTGENRREVNKKKDLCVIFSCFLFTVFTMKASKRHKLRVKTIWSILGVCTYGESFALRWFLVP
jgi:hypothetical protein